VERHQLHLAAAAADPSLADLLIAGSPPMDRFSSRPDIRISLQQFKQYSIFVQNVF
jgi:hypothetical protein